MHPAAFTERSWHHCSTPACLFWWRQKLCTTLKTIMHQNTTSTENNHNSEKGFTLGLYAIFWTLCIIWHHRNDRSMCLPQEIARKPFFSGFKSSSFRGNLGLGYAFITALKFFILFFCGDYFLLLSLLLWCCLLIMCNTCLPFHPQFLPYFFFFFFVNIEWT